MQDTSKVAFREGAGLRMNSGFSRFLGYTSSNLGTGVEIDPAESVGICCIHLLSYGTIGWTVESRV